MEHSQRLRGWVILNDRHLVNQIRSPNGAFSAIGGVGHSKRSPNGAFSVIFTKDDITWT